MKNVYDKDFLQYGKVLKGLELTELMTVMESTELPEDVVYVPSCEQLEKTDISTWFSEVFFGQMPVQVGFCNGHNSLLNALEYHRSSEINVAVTDMILLLGRLQDIDEDFSYDTSKVEAFFVPKNTAVELYGTTLHYAPCGVNNGGFKCVVVLPQGTNYELENNAAEKEDYPEDRLLMAKNKWLISHPDAKIEGAFAGLRGENISASEINF